MKPKTTEATLADRDETVKELFGALRQRVDAVLEEGAVVDGFLSELVNRGRGREGGRWTAGARFEVRDGDVGGSRGIGFVVVETLDVELSDMVGDVDPDGAFESGVGGLLAGESRRVDDACRPTEKEAAVQLRENTILITEQTEEGGARLTLDKASTRPLNFCRYQHPRRSCTRPGQARPRLDAEDAAARHVWRSSGSNHRDVVFEIGVSRYVLEFAFGLLRSKTTWKPGRQSVSNKRLGTDLKE
jgi:hypothetical protein